MYPDTAFFALWTPRTRRGRNFSLLCPLLSSHVLVQSEHINSVFIPRRNLERYTFTLNFFLPRACSGCCFPSSLCPAGEKDSKNGGFWIGPSGMQAPSSPETCSETGVLLPCPTPSTNSKFPYVSGLCLFFVLQTFAENRGPGALRGCSVLTN